MPARASVARVLRVALLAHACRSAWCAALSVSSAPASAVAGACFSASATLGGADAAYLVGAGAALGVRASLADGGRLGPIAVLL